MQATEQLFYTNLDHLSARNSTHSPLEQDLERRQSALHGNLGKHAQAHG
jgi:hypothetical protein